MKKLAAVVAAVAIYAAFETPAFAKTMTVKGVVVDEGCSLRTMADKKVDRSVPSEMDQCAIECAKSGEPVALMTDDGKVYRIGGGLAANKNAKLVPHMNHKVQITGEISEKDGKTIIAADALTMVK